MITPEQSASDLAEALDALAGMVNQHCTGPEGEQAGEWDTGALSANAAAVRILARHGRVSILRERGRMVVFTWVAA